LVNKGYFKDKRKRKRLDNHSDLGR
jgi:hypothetical protein